MTHEKAKFGPFLIDHRSERLMRGDDVVALRPKAFALLKHLVAEPGKLLTKESLLSEMWQGRVVSEAGLSEIIRELRKTLGDDAKSPRFIETVHGKGYRFVCDVEIGDTELMSIAGLERVAPVGRQKILEQLLGISRRAFEGDRQIVFVSGEPGIGKTTVVDAFCHEVTLSRGGALIGRGQCIEQYGSGEAYLPIYEAFTQLARGADGRRVAEVLRQCAPTFLNQLPALTAPDEAVDLAVRAAAASRERMLREVVDAVEEVARPCPLILVFEDLHWGDYSTVDFLTYVAQRSGLAHLMIIATYRPAEVSNENNALGNALGEMTARSQCVDIRLPRLGPDAVREFIEHRFASNPAFPGLETVAEAVHQRTEGHPLFMVNVADFIEDTEFSDLPESVILGLPDTVRQVIVRQYERLTREQQTVLALAAVAGHEFSAASVAAGNDVIDIDTVEDCCTELVRRGQFLVARESTVWPDGTVSAQFAFSHALYQNVIYFLIPSGKRARQHDRIARREEAAWGERAGEIAAELAAHYESAQQYSRATEFYALAGDKAVSRWADREAIELYTRALDLLQNERDPLVKRQRELRLRIARGVPQIHVLGYAAPEVGDNYARARALLDGTAGPDLRLSVLWGLWLFHVVRGDHELATEFADQLRETESREAQRFPLANYAWGCSNFWMGNSVVACDALDLVDAAYDSELDPAQIDHYSQDPRVVSKLYKGWSLLLTGCPDAARDCGAEALHWAKQLEHPFTLVFAYTFYGVIRALRREPGEVSQLADDAIALCVEHDFEFFRTWATMLKGHALAHLGETDRGVETLLRGLEDHERAGARMATTLWQSLLADACCLSNESDRGLGAIARALEFSAVSGEAAFCPELHRLRGELLLKQDPQDSEGLARRELSAAVAVAEDLGAVWLQLKAAISYARFERTEERLQYLQRVHARIDEKPGVADFIDAQALLDRSPPIS